MMKNLFSFLAILMLTNVHSCVDLFMNMDNEHARAQAEQEVYRCFRVLKDGGVYTLNGSEITNIPHPIFTNPMGNLFPLTRNTLNFITENLFGDDDAGDDLWMIASKVYQLFMANATTANAIPFHNICHGLHTMFYSMLMLESAFNLDSGTDESQLMYGVHGNDDDTKKVKLSLAGFAGLFHDAGHNGYGNHIHKYDNTLTGTLYDNLIAGLKAQTGWNWDNFVGITNTTRGINQLRQMLNVTLRGANIGEAFIWEKIHTAIADAVYVIFDGPDDNAANRAQVKRMIMNTNMAHQHTEYAQKAYISLMRKGSVNGANYDDFRDGGFQEFVQDMDNIVHAADISLNGSNTTNLVLIQVPLVLQEFVDELTAMRQNNYYDGNYNSSGPYGALCHNKVYGTLYSAGQTGFNNYVIIPYLSRKPFFTTYILQNEVPPLFTPLLEIYQNAYNGYQGDEYTSTVEAMTNLHEDHGALNGKITGVNLLTAMATDIVQNGAVYNSTDVPYVSYLVNNLNLSNDLFNAPVDVNHQDYMPFTDNEFQTACRVIRRMRVERKAVRKSRKLIV